MLSGIMLTVGWILAFGGIGCAILSILDAGMSSAAPEPPGALYPFIMGLIGIIITIGAFYV